MNAIKQHLPILAGTVVVAILAGCASGNYQKGDSTGADLQASADRISQGSGKIETALTNLMAIVNSPGDLPAQFKKFSAAVSDLQSSAKDVAGKVEAMSKRGEAYFAAWDEQIASIKNEDIKSRSVDRKTEVQKQFAAIRQSYEEASTAFKPFMSDLSDIQTALATDLTPGGVSAIKSAAERAVKSGNSLKGTMGKLATQFKELGVAMSASMPQPAPAK
jgi:DNA repair exonuclease SbcCD ATPase subunit